MNFIGAVSNGLIIVFAIILFRKIINKSNKD